MKSNDIIDSIENVRTINNNLWMGILRIAARYAPTETADLLAQIRLNDSAVKTMTEHLENALRREAVSVLHDQ